MLARSTQKLEIKKLISSINREDFIVSNSQKSIMEIAIPTFSNQTLTSINTVSEFLNLANIQKYDNALELGTGTGFQTVALASLSRSVLSYEINKDLFLIAKRNIRKYPQHKKITLINKDGITHSTLKEAFNVILVCFTLHKGLEYITSSLVNGGRAIIPIQDGKSTKLYYCIKSNEQLIKHYVRDCNFVPQC